MEVPIPSLLFMVVVLNTEEVAKRFVEVIEVAVILAGLKLVADKFVKKALVDVIDVPEAVVKVNRPAKFERLDIYKLVDVIEVATKFLKNALVEVIDVPLALAKFNVPAKFAKLEMYKFVEVKLTPLAVLNVNGPFIVVVAKTIVPSANTRRVPVATLEPTLNIEEVEPVEEENTDKPPWE